MKQTDYPITRKTVILGSLFTALTLIALNAPSTANAGSGACKYSEETTRDIKASNIQQLNVLAGAGKLEVIGNNTQIIKIEARLCSNDQDALANMSVSDKLDDGIIAIETEFPDNSFWGKDRHASIDLVLSVPKDIALDIKDSSGAAEIRNVASLNIIDSSGELEIEDIAGDVIALDSSGLLRVENVSGSVTITDSSGDIEVSSIEKDLTVNVDSSGDIDARDINGNVLIKVDSSGAISVKDIDGDFTVGKDSSGGVKHHNVKGKISLPN
jgi:hypothetical protein